MTKNSFTRDLAYIAVFAALIIVLGFVSIPTPINVPIVLQNGAVIIAAIILGPRRGLLAVLLFLLIAALGLPVLSGGRSLLVALQGPTIGYIVAYPIAALIAGTIAYRAGRTKASMFTSFIIASVVGLATQYILGAIGMSFRTEMDLSAALAAQLGFILPDLPEIIAGIFIAISVHSAFPDLMNRRSNA
ncbi:biotin transporter BioY [Corynebacterium freiburgense]|uniref:biotin transporter BioY n=1 Tax=Corynebacterium freiburgense TaxID=556548 RepID=UPI0003FD8FD5|nr:biotin transporter BioY [Corynebacterium freiburgense]WJZ02914.1 Biotin transporter BioY [Corynebacterium freiburgense]